MRTTDRWVTLALQAFDLRALLPTAQSRIRHQTSTLTSVFELQPTTASCRYTVQLCYRLGWRPEVRVINPTLHTREGVDRIPHTFDNDLLCLHLDDEWRPTMRLADTIVPWASEWLFYYELWLTTGVWHGGGHGEQPASHGRSASVGDHAR
ncbi:hypothetical protein QRX60_48845 [Amycolatopsis mongoliensis]|uniref:Type II CBASS E2 protein domain-containing protein n=1 Tax=Amycolatopsis mongoliensis TaxID=715475 RepID=A0A9Y2JRW7_9PSEU|nr:hypothetical protein [Amycolatopsis sp. 4-36]WIY01834.1 hypothetical protein QRX60_48845 [Amycolatopsis sp. 4-36]